MVADVIDIIGLLFAVLSAGEDAADVGLAVGAGTQAGGIRQQGLEELDGDDLMALKVDGGGGEHTHVFQALHVGEVALPEGHEEADALHLRDVQGQRLDLLVVQQVHILVAHLIEMVFPLDAHGGDLDPVAVLPVAAGSGNLPQVYLGVEVGGEGVAVVAAVAVQNVNGVDLVELVLFGVGAVGLGDAGIKTAAKQRGETGLFKLFPVGPLPAVIEVGGKARFLASLFIDGAPGRVVGILRLVVGGIHIVDAAGQAGVHDGQVLIGQGDVHDEIGLVAVDQFDQPVHVVRVHLGGGNLCGGFALQRGGQRVALGFCPAGDAQLGEYVADLTALADGHVGHAAAADN